MIIVVVGSIELIDKGKKVAKVFMALSWLVYRVDQFLLSKLEEILPAKLMKLVQIITSQQATTHSLLVYALLFVIV